MDAWKTKRTVLIWKQIIPDPGILSRPSSFLHNTPIAQVLDPSLLVPRDSKLMTFYQNTLLTIWGAAVSCTPNLYRLGGVGFVFWLTGKLGCAWHSCMASLHGWCMVWCVFQGGGGVKCHSRIPCLPVNQNTNPTPPNLYRSRLDDTAAEVFNIIDELSSKLRNFWSRF